MEAKSAGAEFIVAQEKYRVALIPRIPAKGTRRPERASKTGQKKKQTAYKRAKSKIPLFTVSVSMLISVCSESNMRIQQALEGDPLWRQI